MVQRRVLAGRRCRCICIARHVSSFRVSLTIVVVCGCEWFVVSMNQVAVVPMRGNRDSPAGNPEISRKFRKQLRKARREQRGWGKRRKEKVRDIYQRKNRTWMNTHTTALMESIVLRRKKERREAKRKAAEEKKKAAEAAAQAEVRAVADRAAAARAPRGEKPSAKVAPARKATSTSRRQAPTSRALY